MPVGSLPVMSVYSVAPAPKMSLFRLGGRAEERCSGER